MKKINLTVKCSDCGHKEIIEIFGNFHIDFIDWENKNKED